MVKKWVRDDNERSVRALFKAASQKHAGYGLAMERLAYRLGDELGLPVPKTYLDRCQGVDGCAQLEVQGIAWKHAAAGISWLDCQPRPT